MKKKKRNKQHNGRPNTTQKPDTKGVIRSRNSKDRQYNEKKEKEQTIQWPTKYCFVFQDIRALSTDLDHTKYSHIRQ